MPTDKTNSQMVIPMPLLRLLLIVLSAFGLGPVAWAHSGVQNATPDAAEVVIPDNGARTATLSLNEARRLLDAAAPGARAQRLAEVLAVAKRRHDGLAVLVDTNPAEFLRVSLPVEQRSNMPAEVNAFLEQDADETGDLQVLHVDHANPADNFYLHFLNTAKGKFSLHFAGKAPDLVTGTHVRVRGMKLDSAIVLAAGDMTSTTTSTVTVLSNALGPQRTLTILVNFSDAPTAQPYTVAQAQDVMFNSTSSYDYETSYQQTTLTGQVAGWFTIAETTATCNYTNIASQAKQAATNAGFVLSNYSRYVYVFPANTCAWWGLGSVGGNPSQAWIHAKYGLSLTVVGHEMGHNFGLYHSHSLDCGTVAIAGSGCVADEYGDLYDMMGSQSRTPHYNAYHKERLGWLNAGVSPPLTMVPAQSGSATYTIAPLEDARNTVSRALKIPRGTSCTASSEWFYVESRQAKGFDGSLSTNANVQTGVLVHKVTDGVSDSSYLLDMTPATTSWSDPALVAGQTFTDPLTGLVIMPLSVGSSGASVSVTFPPASCTRAAPGVALTPAGTVWTAAGATTSYAVSVTNQDSCGCSPTTYDVGGAVPPGWSASTARTSIVAPGGVVSAAISITTAADAAPAFYTVGVNATNSSAPTAVAVANGTIAIASAPAVTASTDKTGYTRPTKRNETIYASITTTVTSGGTAAAGAAVSVKVTNPSGSATTLTGTTSSSGTVTVLYPIKNTSVTGNHLVTSTATLSGMKGSATTSFVVQ